MTFSRFRSSFLSDLLHSLRSKACCYYKIGCYIKLIAESAVHLIRDWEVNGSNPSVVEKFSTRLSFGRNSSDISGFMFKRVKGR